MIWNNMIILLVTLTSIAIALIITLVVIINRLLFKINLYESWILDTKDKVQESLDDMRKIDQQGIFATSVRTDGLFESDDMVGQIFKQLQEIVDDLNSKIE